MNPFLSAVAILSGDSGGIVHALLYLVVIGIILGIIQWLVNAAPFLPDLFKKVLGWLIIAAGAIIIINFLLSLVGRPIFAY